MSEGAPLPEGAEPSPEWPSLRAAAQAGEPAPGPQSQGAEPSPEWPSLRVAAQAGEPAPGPQSQGAARPVPSYWERTTYLAPADLVVVGAGITGTSVALYHKRRFPRQRVVVIDRGWIPSGATTRNAGFACFGSVSELLDDMTLDTSETVIARMARRIRGLRRLREELGDGAIGYEACGGAEIFTDAEAHGRCVAHIPEINRALQEATGLSEAYRQTTRNGLPAIDCPSEGAIHSGRMMMALHGAARDAGAEFLFGVAAGRPQRGGGGAAGAGNGNSGADPEAETGGECSWRIPLGGNGEAALCARRVVVAANGFAGGVLDVPVHPARGLILVSRPLEDSPWKGVFHYNKGYVYFRHLPDGRLLLGGARDVDPAGERTTAHGANPAIRAWLMEFAERVLRVPLQGRVDMEWTGTMGFTDQKDPLCRQLEPGLWCLAGLSGIGVSIGMEAAWELVERMASAEDN